MKNKNKSESFAICISSTPTEDLETWKVYQVISDPSAVAVECVRVVDESGVDYLYPASRFIILDLTDANRKRLLAAAKARRK